MADPHTLYAGFLALFHADPADLDRRAAEIVDPAFVIHQRRAGDASEEVRGPDALVRLVRQGKEPFADVKVSVTAGPLAERDLVAGRWRFEGTYRGGIPGADAPAGTRVSFGGNDIMRIGGGRLVEYWASSDESYLMAQLRPG